ncbi:MAG: hypothetical protein ACFFAO_04345 [Candidatus Hermodarchaeota archaeon]
MNTEFRKKFLMIMGEAYKAYGFPQITGWIKAVLYLENRELGQVEISEKITEILSNEDAPTSVPSVNRALKIMEGYRAIVKSGTRKKGYTYKINPFKNIPLGLFRRFSTINKNTIKNLNNLRVDLNQTEDKGLTDAIEKEIESNQSLLNLIEKILHLDNQKS